MFALGKWNFLIVMDYFSNVLEEFLILEERVSIFRLWALCHLFKIIKPKCIASAHPFCHASAHTWILPIFYIGYYLSPPTPLQRPREMYRPFSVSWKLSNLTFFGQGREGIPELWGLYRECPTNSDPHTSLWPIILSISTSLTTTVAMYHVKRGGLSDRSVSDCIGIYELKPKDVTIVIKYIKVWADHFFYKYNKSHIYTSWKSKDHIKSKGYNIQ